MAKPNYSFEKRQRELAKRKKKESKAEEKAARKTQPGDPMNPDEADTTADAPADSAEPNPQ